LPANWTVIPFSELLSEDRSISVGVMYPGGHTLNGVPLIKVSDVTDGNISSEPSYRISQEVHQEYRRTELEGNELLITLVGNPGEAIEVTPAMAGWNVARALAVARLKDPTLVPFIRYVFRSSPMRSIIASRLNTTVQATLNLKDIKELPIPLPEKKERSRITQTLAAIDDRINLNQQINQTLEQMAQAMFKSWFVDFEPVKAKIAANKAGRDPERAAMCALSGKTETQLDQLPQAKQKQLVQTAALFPDAFEFSSSGKRIPRTWKPTTLKAVAEFAYGKALKKSNRKPGPFPVYGSGGITGYHESPLVEGPGIIVGRKGTVGSIFWEDSPFYPIDTVF